MPLISTRTLQRFLLSHTKYRKQKFPYSLPIKLEKSYDRTEVVKEVCGITNAKRYLEIGCCTDYTFQQIPVKEKIGVDPERGGTHRMTSDAFFAENTLKFDVIFIDGLHEYSQVHKDIVNSLAVLNKGGIIVLDDMIPKNWMEEYTPSIQPIWAGDIWTGDVWKCAFEICATKGLDFKLLLCGTGTGVIKPEANHDKLADLSHELSDKRFAYLYNNLDRLPLVDTEAGLAWIRAGKE